MVIAGGNVARLIRRIGGNEKPGAGDVDHARFRLCSRRRQPEQIPHFERGRNFRTDALSVPIQKRGFIHERIRDPVDGKGALFINGELPGGEHADGVKA